MHFDNRRGDGGDGIGKRNRGMRVGPGIKNNTLIIFRFGAMQAIDEFAFVVTLVVIERYSVGVARAQDR